MSGAAAPRVVVDVGDDTFEREVIERSRTTPVVVDFWAPWCGPCRVLGPVLERLAAEHAGAFVLAKVNVDTAARVAQVFRIQSIPAVKGFRDGAVVAEFVGAEPEPGVRRFLASVLPSEADRLVRDGDARAAAGDAAGAADAFAAALAREPRHGPALLGLARRRAAEGKDAEALTLIDRVAPGSPAASEAERFAAELRTHAGAGGDETALRASIAARPDDLESRLALGRLLASRERYEDALGELLEVVRRDRSFDDEAARKAMLDVFSVLGPRHPVTERYRGELAKALFS